MVTRWRLLKELVQLETLRRGSLTVLIANALRSCRIRLDRATSRRGMRTPMATKAFADGPAAIVRMEHSAHSDGRMKLMGVWNVQDVDWTLQAVTEDLMDALKGTDDAAPGASDSVVNKRAREQSKGRISQITAPSGHEIQSMPRWLLPWL